MNLPASGRPLRALLREYQSSHPPLLPRLHSTPQTIVFLSIPRNVESKCSYQSRLIRCHISSPLQNTPCPSLHCLERPGTAPRGPRSICPTTLIATQPLSLIDRAGSVYIACVSPIFDLLVPGLAPNSGRSPNRNSNQHRRHGLPSRNE